MRKVLLLALAVMACAAFTLAPPTPKTPSVRATMRVAGSTLWVRWTVAATPSDSLTVDVSATGNPGTHKMYVADSKTDSVGVAKPQPGASITVSLLAKNWRGPRNAAAPLASGTYVEPDTTVVPPSVQLQLIPASGTVTPGSTTTFTVPS